MKSWYRDDAFRLEANREVLSFAVACGLRAAPESGAFLQALWQLNTLPTEYLVCDEALLPMESLRLFRVDEYWVDCLLDGALSLGRNGTLDMQHDAVLRGILLEQFRAGKDEQAGERSGFLLRSELVRAWPDMSVICWADPAGTSVLDSQTVTRIGEDIILCIVNGCIQRLGLTLPETGLSFGFTWDEAGTLCLPLSPLPLPGVDGEEQTYRRVPEGDALAIPVPFRQQTVQGVVDVEALCGSIERALKLEGTASLSALELSAELLQTPVRYSVKGDFL